MRHGQNGRMRPFFGAAHVRPRRAVHALPGTLNPLVFAAETR